MNTADLSRPSLAKYISLTLSQQVKLRTNSSRVERFHWKKKTKGEKMSNCRPFFINHLKVAPHVASFIQAIELLPDGVQFISLPPVHSAADLSILEISTSSSSIFSFLKMKIFFSWKNKTEICWPTSLTGKNHPQRCKFGQKSQCGPLSFFFSFFCTENVSSEMHGPASSSKFFGLGLSDGDGIPSCLLGPADRDFSF